MGPTQAPYAAAAVAGWREGWRLVVGDRRRCDGGWHAGEMAGGGSLAAGDCRMADGIQPRPGQGISLWPWDASGHLGIA